MTRGTQCVCLHRVEASRQRRLGNSSPGCSWPTQPSSACDRCATVLNHCTAALQVIPGHTAILFKVSGVRRSAGAPPVETITIVAKLPLCSDGQPTVAGPRAVSRLLHLSFFSIHCTWPQQPGAGKATPRDRPASWSNAVRLLRI